MSDEGQEEQWLVERVMSTIKAFLWSGWLFAVRVFGNPRASLSGK
jgi:hypothetical protein